MAEHDLRLILSQNIKKLRGYRKLSQAKLAEMINISIPFLSDIENGKKWVSPVTLAKIADALDIHAYELLKPETIVPDNVANILEKYTDDIYQKFGETLNFVQRNYLFQYEAQRKIKQS